MALKIQQKMNNQSWENLLVEDSKNSPNTSERKRKQLFRRMYKTVGILFLSSFLVYCSLFYIGAFFDAGKIIGVSQEQRAQSTQYKIKQLMPTHKRTIASPFFDLFKTNRIYLRKGQSILATYSLPQGASITLTIEQCKSTPVVEIFSCKFSGKKKTVIHNKTAGHIRFTVSGPGFYYFNSDVSTSAQIPLELHKDYQVIWQRA
ncbi:MAG: hypothetical protein V3U57_01710 [Robiginitomaculum sp.]